MTTVVNDMREGTRQGYVYMNPIDALTTQLIDGTQNIANKNTRDSLKALGPTISERSNAALKEIIDQGGEDLAAAKSQAAKDYSAATKTNDPIEIAAAAERLRRANFALRAVRQSVEKEIAFKQELGVEAQRLGRILPVDIAREIDSYYRFGPGDRDYFNEAMQLWRATRTVGDYSQIFVQGTNLLYRRPDLWWKTTVGSILASSKNNMPIKYVHENLANIMDGIRTGAITPPSEFLLSGIPNSINPTWVENAAHLFGEIPGVKQTQRSFEWFSFLGQSELWMASKGLIEAGASPAEVASMVRKSLGVVMQPGLTRKQRDISQGLFFAPRFFKAVTTLMADTARGGARGSEARATLGRVIAGGTALTISAELLLNGKLPNFSDPSKSDWGSIHTGGGTINLYGPMYTYFRAIARAGQAVANGEPSKALDPMFTLTIGKTSLPLSAAISVLVGSNPVTGEEMKRYEDRSGFARTVKGIGNAAVEVFGKNLGPIGPAQVLRYLVEKPESQPLFWEIVGEVFGARTNPYTPSQYRDILRNQHSLDAYSKTYPDITEKQKLEIDSLKDVSLARDLSVMANIERGGPTGRFQQALLNSDIKFAQTMTTLISSPNYTGKQYRLTRQKAMGIRADDRNDAEKAYSPYRATEIDNTVDPKVQAIYDLSIDSQDPKTGLSYADMNMEWKFFEDRDARIKDLNPEQKQDYEALSQRYILNLPQALQAKELEYRHDMDMLRTYWDVQKLVANSFGTAGEAYLSIKRLESVKDPRAREYKAVLGTAYNRIDSLVSDSKESLRKYQPEIDIALKKWGHTTLLLIEK